MSQTLDPGGLMFMGCCYHGNENMSSRSFISFKSLLCKSSQSGQTRHSSLESLLDTAAAASIRFRKPQWDNLDSIPESRLCRCNQRYLYGFGFPSRCHPMLVCWLSRCILFSFGRDKVCIERIKSRICRNKLTCIQ